jgi:transposase
MVTVLSGQERRRRWTTAEKLRIVQESQAPGAMVSEIARRHDVHPNQLHSCRRTATKTSRTSRGPIAFRKPMAAFALALTSDAPACT